MRLKVLGCSGGIGPDLRTTAMLADHDVLIDAGTGVGDLAIAELACIDHVFLTHAHLDHVCFLPLLADAVGPQRAQPLMVHALAGTIETLRRHLFNGQLWPDFTRLPRPGSPYLQLHEIRTGERVEIAGRAFTAIPAEHTVPAVGYWIDSGAASLVFSGDTGPNPALWEAVNAIANLRHLLIETAFCDRDCALALAARHLCPRLLRHELGMLKRPVQIHVTHLKPADRETLIREIEEAASEYRPQVLAHGQVLQF
jgi:glyoxylase-like metal-dependent hydrolase (beta-lactamase superfamily II)